MRVVEEAEGRAEAAVAAAKDRECRKRRLPQPLSRREDEDDTAIVMLQCSTSIIATVLVPAVKWVYVTVTHSRYQNRTSVTGFKCVYVTVTHSRYQNGTSVTGIKVSYS